MIRHRPPVRCRHSPVEPGGRDEAAPGLPRPQCSQRGRHHGPVQLRQPKEIRFWNFYFNNLQKTSFTNNKLLLSATGCKYYIHWGKRNNNSL